MWLLSCLLPLTSNQSQEMLPLPEQDSARGFFLLKWTFSFPLSPSPCSHTLISSLLGRCWPVCKHQLSTEQTVLFISLKALQKLTVYTKWKWRMLTFKVNGPHQWNQRVWKGTFYFEGERFPFPLCVSFTGPWFDPSAHSLAERSQV